MRKEKKARKAGEGRGEERKRKENTHSKLFASDLVV